MPAQVNCVDSRAYSPLYLAVQRGHHAVAELLIELGANVELTDGHGVSVRSSPMGGGRRERSAAGEGYPVSTINYIRLLCVNRITLGFAG